MRSTLIVLSIVLTACTQPVHRLEVPYSAPVPPPTPQVAIPPAVDDLFAAAVNTWKKTGKAPVLKHQGVLLYPYTDGIVIRCENLRVTDVEFPESEVLGRVIIGNNAEWDGLNSLGGGRWHLALSPKEKGAKTNVIAYTNLRTYTIEAIEGGNGNTRVGFWFPAEMEAQIRERERALAKIAPARAENERYQWEGNAAFAPVRVFDDGTRVYILLPEQVRVQKFPVLYVTSQGKDELVNFSAQWPWLIVPQLFDRASLVLGAGRQQERVNIWRAR